MSSHAVGNDEQIPTPLPLVGIARSDNRITVLIVRATHPDVGASYSKHDRRPIRWGLGHRILSARGFVCQVRFQTTSKLELELARSGDPTGYSIYRPVGSNRTRPQQPNLFSRTTPEDRANYNDPHGRAVRVLYGFTADYPRGGGTAVGRVPPPPGSLRRIGPKACWAAVAISEVISSIRLRNTANAPREGIAIKSPATVVIKAE